MGKGAIMGRHFTTRGLLSLMLIVPVCCTGEDASPALGVGDVVGRQPSQNPGTVATAGTSAVGAPGSNPLPPETEVEGRFEAPVATGSLVWVANPESGRVALVHAETLEVTTAEAGFAPTYLAAVPTDSADNAAIVINTLSHDATLLTVSDSGSIESKFVDIHAGANAWSVSRAGRWAIAWTDAAKVPGADSTEGFQDITVIDLAGDELEATRLSVGYRPSRLVIDDSEEHAYVVTEPGISVIDLGAEDGPEVLKDVTVPTAPDPSQREVEITADGRLALVQNDNSQVLYVIDLETSDSVSIALDHPISDLDLSADGETAVAVVRGQVPPPANTGAGGGVGAGGSVAAGGGGAVGGGAEGGAGTTADSGAPTQASADAGAGEQSAGGAAGAPVEAGAAGDEPVGGGTGPVAAEPDEPARLVSQVALLDVGRIFESPDSYRVIDVEGELFGSASVPTQGSRVLLYTNATPSDRLTILDTEDDSYRTVVLNAPVQAVIPTGNGSHAVALLSPPQRPAAFSLVPVTKNLPPKIQGTDAPIQSVAVLPDSDDYALVTTRGTAPNSYGVYLAKMPELQVDLIPLSSAPTATGVVPDVGVGFVAQEHPEGRITFINLAEASARTLTGFELGVKVVDGE